MSDPEGVVGVCGHAGPEQGRVEALVRHVGVVEPVEQGFGNRMSQHKPGKGPVQSDVFETLEDCEVVRSRRFLDLGSDHLGVVKRVM